MGRGTKFKPEEIISKLREAEVELAREKKIPEVAVLLLPAIIRLLRHPDLLTLLDHSIGIKSIDLDQPWPKIHDRLLNILA